jgi:hypothetical protein
MTDLYFWRNVEQKPCSVCGKPHEFVSRRCVPLLFTDDFIKYERLLARDEFAKAIEVEREWERGAGLVE